MGVCRFTTLEPSPKGKGKCAWNFKVGKRGVGTDGCVWKVAKSKAGKKYWQRQGGFFPEKEGEVACEVPPEGGEGGSLASSPARSRASTSLSAAGFGAGGGAATAAARATLPFLTAAETAAFRSALG